MGDGSYKGYELQYVQQLRRSRSSATANAHCTRMATAKARCTRMVTANAICARTATSTNAIIHDLKHCSCAGHHVG